VEEHLPRKCEALNSNPSFIFKKVFNLICFVTKFLMILSIHRVCKSKFKPLLLLTSIITIASVFFLGGKEDWGLELRILYLQSRHSTA
jgi:hypothetical protein